MFKKLKKLNIFLLNIIFASSLSTGVSAKALDTEYTNVDLNKKWQINFNMQLDKSSVNTDNILVLEKNTNKNLPIDVSLSNNKKAITVNSYNSYKPNTEYIIVVNKNVKSSDGKNLSSPKVIDFTTVNKKAPLNICIDAGHGKTDSGIAYNGVSEKDIDLSVALKTGESLKTKGYAVTYTRTVDDFKWNPTDLTPRANIAKENNCDYYISIHNNDAVSSSATGIESFVNGDKGRTLALNIQNSMQNTNFVNRGVKDGIPNEIKYTSIPSVKLLLGFMNNPNELKNLTNNDIQNKIANNITAAVDKTYKNPAPTPAPVPKPTPIIHKTICIDAGHGGYDSGAVGPSGTLEKNITLSVALKLGKILEQKGIKVVYTRTSDNVSWTTDINNDLQTRCDISNAANADEFIAIHTNSADISNAYGTETFNYSSSSKGALLAQYIQKELVKSLGSYDRGVKTANFYVIKHTNAPAILTELGFISNSTEEKLLNSDDYQNKCAQGIANGVFEYLKNN